jgi:hypothetical protein
MRHAFCDEGSKIINICVSIHLVKSDKALPCHDCFNDSSIFEKIIKETT